MVFSTTLFLFIFLPLTLAVYFIIGKKLRNYWLLLVSLVFFAWSQPNYLWIILLNITINYSCAMLIDRSRKYRKLYVILAMVANLAILYYFKYFDFTIDSINRLLGSGFSLKHIILPIGISFFTFQGMSYVIDVYRNDVAAQKNILKVALYVALFPQLIAGPIVRYKDIAAEVNSRTITMDDFASGIERFIIGLAKKAIIANTLAVTADAIWARGAANNTTAIAWAGSIAYGLQIYFDFSGYSDMAIGLGRMFGFHFRENFNLPYISKSLTEFWRRWHISLSSWFKDYVYIPLGGNRKHVYLNLVIVFLLTGFWHGASWHFVAWGIWNGFFLIIERLCRNKQIRLFETSGSVLKSIALRVYALLVIYIGWVLFRSESITEFVTYIKVMFGLMNAEYVGFTVFWYLDHWTMTVMALAIIFSTSLPVQIAAFCKERINEKVYSIAKYAMLLLLLFFSMLRIVSGTYNPFIYFQF